jgi:DeoR family suf operon transcriptional repressor
MADATSTPTSEVAVAPPAPDGRVARAFDQLPAGRRSLLMAIKRRGHATVEELAEDLSITVSAVRQLLAATAEAGLTAHEDVRDGPGRPRHLHHLTGEAEALFPRAYGELTTELLGCVAEEDPELLARVFERRRTRRVERANARMAGLDLAGKVHELARVLDDDGYLAEAIANDDGTFRIVEHNCAILNVALRYGQACGTELSFIREVLPGATVERVQHLLDGSHVCAYAISP